MPASIKHFCPFPLRFLYQCWSPFFPNMQLAFSSLFISSLLHVAIDLQQYVVDALSISTGGPLPPPLQRPSTSEYSSLSFVFTNFQNHIKGLAHIFLIAIKQFFKLHAELFGMLCGSQISMGFIHYGYHFPTFVKELNQQGYNLPKLSQTIAIRVEELNLAA